MCLAKWMQSQKNADLNGKIAKLGQTKERSESAGKGGRCKSSMWQRKATIPVGCVKLAKRERAERNHKTILKCNSIPPRLPSKIVVFHKFNATYGTRCSKAMISAAD
jgi:hypothetical protein